MKIQTYYSNRQNFEKSLSDYQVIKKRPYFGKLIIIHKHMNEPSIYYIGVKQEEYKNAFICSMNSEVGQSFRSREIERKLFNDDFYSNGIPFAIITKYNIAIENGKIVNPFGR